MHPQDYLDRLQLESDASERDVRRAYARELKKLDLQEQPDAFEALRKAYEHLLNWVRDDAAQDSPESSSPTRPLLPLEREPNADRPIDDGHAKGLEVLETVVARLRDQPFVTQREAELLLHACMQDSRLINLDARTAFEGGIVSTLVNGWRPGHEFLLNAAVNCFDWGELGQGLKRFGSDGLFMDAAIDEMFIVDALPLSTRMHYRRVIKAMYRTEPPGNSELLASYPVVEYLLEYFPHWMHIVSREEAMTHWQTWHAQWHTAMEEQNAQANDDAMPVPHQPGVFEKIKKIGIRFLKTVIGLVVLVTAIHIGAGIYANIHAYEVVVALMGAPESENGEKAASSVDKAKRAYDETVAREIRPHMSAAGMEDFQGVRGAEFYLVLSPSGAIQDIQFVNSSGNQRWDTMSYWALQSTKAIPLNEKGSVPKKMLIVLKPIG